MFKVEGKKKYRIAILISAIILVAVFLLSFCLGRFPVSIGEVFDVIASKFSDISADSKQELIVLGVRLPRILLACIVGCALSAAGASYQGVFQNPMAAPDILGASSGAAFGASLGLLLGMPQMVTALFAFGTGIASVLVVVFIAERAKGKKIIGLVLAGIMISSLFTSGTSFIKLVADPNDQLPKITYWLMGSLSGAEIKDVLFVIIPILIGLVPLFLFKWKINILTLGDDEARTMGVNVKSTRLVVILCATLVTAAAVSVSGLIGWVGLVVPHIARRVVGNNYKYLMPAAMIFGALFLLVVDDFARSIADTEVPIGILTSFIGAPFFIYLITRRERF